MLNPKGSVLNPLSSIFAANQGLHVLQCVAVCCSVLHCVAVWCSVLQSVAERCRVLQCVAEWNAQSKRQRPQPTFLHLCCQARSVFVAVCCSVLQCHAECCSMVQCVAMCCGVLQCVAMCCSVLQCIALKINVMNPLSSI